MRMKHQKIKPYKCFKNVIIVTYFSQRRMLYGDTTLPSTLRNTGKGGAKAQFHLVAHGPGLTMDETKLSGSLEGGKCLHGNLSPGALKPRPNLDMCECVC